ncbi:Gfo/Idh/MocA family oxidoreductase [Mesorhizobium sp. 1B3]|uniref:Gfo/Idh/MocA family oxidoreductase n=1 Tax=Mesorhizobium sp. 1B3 TaxID=3243599 RepID=UPI003D985DF7
MRVGILGSGFGLYGYLPALIGLRKEVVLPVRYRQKLMGRNDVAHLDSHIKWVQNEEALLASSDALVISQRPCDQVSWVELAISSSDITHYLLEKPLAPSPTEARTLLELLFGAGNNVRIGYTFRFTSWAARLKAVLAQASPDDRLLIEWRFRAHHYATDAETWKRHHSQGGGALRFYGIHVIALLAELGYRQATASCIEGAGDDDARRWEATFAGPRLPNCSTYLDSDAPSASFHVRLADGRSQEHTVVTLRDPFDQATNEGGYDRRVEVLSTLCRSLLDGTPESSSWYYNSIDLWTAAEKGATGNAPNE